MAENSDTDAFCGVNTNQNGGRHWFLTAPSTMENIEDHGFFLFDHNTLEFTFTDQCNADLNYIKVVLEQGAESEGTNYVHWHANIQFRRPHRLAAVKKLFAAHRAGSFEWAEAHLEKVHDASAVEAYIDGDKGGPKEQSKKDGALAGPFTWCRRGMSLEQTGQGSRTDLQQFAALIEAGSTVIDAAHAYPSTFMLFHSGAQKLWSTYHVPIERPKPQIVWLIGPTGCGKSRFARDMCRKQSLSLYSRCTEMGQWYDGYNGQDVILFDDFDDHKESLGAMLRLLDYSPNQQQIKGGHVPVTTNKFIFTLHKHVRENFFLSHNVLGF